MRKLFGLLGLLVVVSLPAWAQDYPLIDVGGGYEFRGWNLAQEPLLKMNGWFATADLNLTDRIALAADISGTYNNGGNLFSSTSIYTYQFGPRIYLLGHHRISPFVHGLFGLGHGTVSLPPDGDLPAFTQTDHSYSWDVGGGVDLAFRRRWALRGQADYDQTQLFGGAPNQNNFKFGLGIVYRLGEK
jgi:hypothetical protein